MSEPQKQKDEATIQVPAKGKGVPGEGKEPQLPPGPNPELADDRKMVELTAEDRELKERLELAVERLRDAQPEIVRNALELLRKELREATSSMTSVPKPLKFLGPHYPALKGIFGAMAAAGGGGENRLLLADILSVLGMTFGRVPNESLRFKLLGHRDDLSSWGTEYVRSLAGEIGSEWEKRLEEEAGTATAASSSSAAAAASSNSSSTAAAEGGNGSGAAGATNGTAAAKAKEIADTLALLGPPASFEELREMIRQIVPFDMAHNAEVEVCYSVIFASFYTAHNVEVEVRHHCQFKQMCSRQSRRRCAVEAQLGNEIGACTYR